MQNPKLQITFTPEMMKLLKQKADESGNSVAAIVRTALVEYLKKNEVLNATKRL